MIKLKQNHDVVVNGADVIKIPYNVSGSIVRAVSSIFLQVRSTNQTFKVLNVRTLFRWSSRMELRCGGTEFPGPTSTFPRVLKAKLEDCVAHSTATRKTTFWRRKTMWSSRLFRLPTSGKRWKSVTMFRKFCPLILAMSICITSPLQNDIAWRLSRICSRHAIGKTH